MKKTYGFLLFTLILSGSLAAPSVSKAEWVKEIDRFYSDTYDVPLDNEDYVIMGTEAGIGVASVVGANKIASRKASQLWHDHLPAQSQSLDQETAVFKQEEAEYQPHANEYNGLMTQYDHAAHGYYSDETRSVPTLMSDGKGGTYMGSTIQHYQEHHDPDPARAAELEPQLGPAKVKFQPWLNKHIAEKAKFEKTEQALLSAEKALLEGGSAEASAVKSALRGITFLRIAGDTVGVITALDLVVKGALILGDTNPGRFPLYNIVSGGVEKAASAAGLYDSTPSGTPAQPRAY